MKNSLPAAFYKRRFDCKHREYNQILGKKGKQYELGL